MTILGIDAGNHEVKVVGPEGPIKFSSKLGLRDRDITLRNEPRPDDMEVVFRGKEWFAGTLAGESLFGGTTKKGLTKANEEVLIRVLLALFKYDNESVHDIVVGQPIKMHKDEEKKKIKALLEGPPHEITVNGVTRAISIRSVQVAAEGASVGLLEPIEGVSHILDVGSGTINWATVECEGKSVRFKDRDSDTINFGLSSREKINFDEVVRLIGNTLTPIWDAEDPVRVVGAVADRLVAPLKEYFPNAVSYHPNVSTRNLDPVYANAAAFFTIARTLYAKKKE